MLTIEGVKCAKSGALGGSDRLYVDTADCAKLIRAALKREFAGTKFAVRSSRYSGGSSIRIRWADGPTQGAVDAIVQRYGGATFDGMTDCKNYHDIEIDGQAVSMGADFIFCNRDMSPEAEARVAAEQAAHWSDWSEVVEYERQRRIREAMSKLDLQEA